MCLKFYLKMYALDTDAIILFATNNIFSLKRNHFRNDGNDSHTDRCIASKLLALFNLGRQTMKQMDQRTSFVKPFQLDVHYSTHATYTTLPSYKTCIWFAMIKYDTYTISRFIQLFSGLFGFKVALPFDSLQLYGNHFAVRCFCRWMTISNINWLNVYIFCNYEYYSIFNFEFEFCARRHEYAPCTCTLHVGTVCFTLCMLCTKWWGVFERLMRADYIFTFPWSIIIILSTTLY